MSDAYEVYPTQTVIKCDDCGDSFNVHWFCKNCPGSLCDSCKERHKTKAITSKHSVVPRTQTVVRAHGPAKIAEQCYRHKGKDITIYCKRCKVGCCAKCHADNHKLHDFCPIEEAYLEKEISLNAYIKELEDGVHTKLDKMIDNAKQDNAREESSIEKEIDDVKEFRKEMKKTVDIQCGSLIDTLRKSNVDKTNITAELQKQKQNVDRLIRECKEKIWEGKLNLIEYSPPSPSLLVPNLPPISLEKAKFVPDTAILDNIRKGLGRIEFGDTGKTEKAVVSSKDREQFDRSKLQVKKLKHFNSKPYATSINIAGKNRAWIADDECDTMYLYDNNGKVIKSVTVAKGVGIRDTVVTSTGEIFVTNEDKKVRRVSVNGTVTILIDTELFKPKGVCLMDTGQIAVCMSEQGGQNHVAIYTHEGRRKVSEIRGSDANKKHVITDPLDVVQNGKDFCVVNSEKNVVCVKQTGECRWIYDGRSAGRGRGFWPVRICCDKYLNLLVSDNYNNCVHYIDGEGQLIQMILTEKQVGLCYHWGIGVDDETSQVWVGNSYKNVAVVKYIK